jgi:hypothetical protein
MKPFSFKSSIVRGSYEYWLSKCAGTRLPRRADIRAKEIPRLLPYVFLVDVVRARGDPPAFRFRLVGTQIITWAGRDHTGAMIDEPSYGPNWRQVHEIYAGVVATREPAYSEYSAPWQGREFLTYERIIAPLSGDGETIDMLFGALDVLK